MFIRLTYIWNVLLFIIHLKNIDVFLEILILISAISSNFSPIPNTLSIIFNVTFLLSGCFLLVLGRVISVIVLISIYSAISVLFLFVIMLIQLTRNQIRQYLMNPLGLEEHTSFEIPVAVTMLLFIIILVFTVFFTIELFFSYFLLILVPH